MDQQPVILKDLVLIGGGHAHVHVLKMIGMKPIPGVRVTLITKDVDTPYSGMLPGHIAGEYSREECHIDLGRLCSFAGVRLLHTEVDGLDLVTKSIRCKDGRPAVKYDVLSIDIGICPKPVETGREREGVPTEMSVTPVKPIDSFSWRWQSILKRVLEMPDSDGDVHIAVIGGGAGGVELCFAMQQRLRRDLAALGKDPNRVKMRIFNRGRTLMSSHNRGVQRIISRLMREKGIEVELGTEIDGVEDRFLTATDGRRFLFHEAVSCTSAWAQPWLRSAGLKVTEPEGFICVKRTLESVNCRDVFACGDVCHIEEDPRPKAGVFAVRAGPPLLANLRHHLVGEPLEQWFPQNVFLGIIGTGDRYAVASKGQMAIEGEFLWTLKDFIDRNWMKGYTDGLPDKTKMMSQPIDPEIAEARKLIHRALVDSIQGNITESIIEKSRMRCGGCGSKVGSQILTRALKRVRIAGLGYDSTDQSNASPSTIPTNQSHYLGGYRPEVITGIGDDAALIKAPLPLNSGPDTVNSSYLVQTIDYFRSFVSDPFVFGKIAAVHSLSDLHAMNAEPVSALALCTVPFGLEEKVEDDLVAMIAGACSVLKQERCALVGGHSSEGAELAMGLALHGTVHPDSVLEKGPLTAGDVLILTKAIGTGVIFAADMRARSKGSWVRGAISSMLQSNCVAASILKSHGCTACTDVTGFGLVGHLVEMIQYRHRDNDKGKIVHDSGLEPCFDRGKINRGPLNFKSDVGAAEQPVCLPEVVSTLEVSSDELLVRLSMDAIPFLPGAVQLAADGLLSSLHSQNVRTARAVDSSFLSDLTALPLIFDPQTSGGLLASLPREKAGPALEALRQAGYHSAAIIGEVLHHRSLPEMRNGASIVLAQY